MRVLFVAGFSPVVQDMTASKKLYVDVLGLPLEGDYPSSGRIDGVKHFGLWSLQEAAKACFGKDHWPADTLIPQANIEFDVDDVEAAAIELERRGYELLHHAKEEPWGQTICRLLSPEGLLVGLSHTPWMRGSSLRAVRCEWRASGEQARQEDRAVARAAAGAERPRAREVYLLFCSSLREDRSLAQEPGPSNKRLRGRT